MYVPASPARGPRKALATVALALLAWSLSCSAASAGPTVTVRVEGEGATLLPATTVTLAGPEPVSGCAANSVAAAINLAVAGNWDHGEAKGAGGDFTETILGETHGFTNESDTWAEWVDYRWGGGICTDLLAEGDEVLMVADHEPEPFFAPTRLPLVISGVPASVQAGAPFAVTVSAVHTPPGTFPEPGQGTAEPIEGATVAGGGVSAPSGAAGVATIALPTAGVWTLRATRPGDAPSRTFQVCVHDGNDGNCGTTPPVAAGMMTLASTTSTPAAPYKGPFALVSSVSGPQEGHSYRRGHAPRVLAGTILAHSPVTLVRLSLRRSYRGRCWAYDSVRERFIRSHCGSAQAFTVSHGASFSYLLPSALAPGRYVLDVVADDSAGNTTTLARGSSRIVFHVR